MLDKGTPVGEIAFAVEEYNATAVGGHPLLLAEHGSPKSCLKF